MSESYFDYSEMSSLKRLPVIDYNSDFSDLTTIDDYYTALTKTKWNKREKKEKYY